jgi:VanZ family protein
MCWAAFILFLCLIPGKDLPSVSIFEADKIGHFGVYLVLSMLMFYGWKRQAAFPSLHQNVFIKILIITSVYGFAVEIMQELFTADRHFDILDAIANSGGAVAGSLISMYLRHKLVL